MADSFEAYPSPIIDGTWFVRGRGAHRGEDAMFWGPEAEERAKAFAALLNRGPVAGGYGPGKSAPG